jgi:hypothetical protein
MQHLLFLQSMLSQILLCSTIRHHLIMTFLPLHAHLCPQVFWQIYVVAMFPCIYSLGVGAEISFRIRVMKPLI